MDWGTGNLVTGMCTIITITITIIITITSPSHPTHPGGEDCRFKSQAPSHKPQTSSPNTCPNPKP